MALSFLRVSVSPWFLFFFAISVFLSYKSFNHKNQRFRLFNSSLFQIHVKQFLRTFFSLRALREIFLFLRVSVSPWFFFVFACFIYHGQVANHVSSLFNRICLLHITSMPMTNAFAGKTAAEAPWLLEKTGVKMAIFWKQR